MKNTFTFILIFLLPFFALAQKTEHRNLENKLAIQGYDPVTYIEQKKAELNPLFYSQRLIQRNLYLLLLNDLKYYVQQSLS